MEIYADLTQRVVVDSNALEWVPSPQDGVDRKMLDRKGDEEARATSLVRYAPGSSFPSHTHDGGEEYFVLEGVFADEHGTYPAGTYVRNPIGSAHASFSEAGCVILVKLWQMTDPTEQRLVVDSNAEPWVPAAVAGLERCNLFKSDSEEEWTYLVRFAPGSQVPDDPHPGGEELFVLEGAVEDEFGRYPAGTWLRQPAGSRHAPGSPEGCLIWVKRGLLPAAAG